MSDLRDELAESFASAENQQSEDVNSNVIEEQLQSQEPAVIDEWMDAPKAYSKEYQEDFKALPQNWRKYLIDREKQAERGFSDLGNKVNNYKWIDDVYSSRQDRLGKMGIAKAQDYINSLTLIDDNMEKDPRATLMALAQAYGVDLNDNNNAYNSLQNQFFDMQKQISGFQDYIKQQNVSKAESEFQSFMGAKDENGNPKHVYFEEVRPIMSNLIQNGMATNYEDAYNKAVWMNEDVRNKIIASQAQAKLNNKVVEATKAKEASFSPKSKQTGEDKEMSLREELERRFGEI